MPSIFQPTPLTAPDILIANNVAMLSSDLDSSPAVDRVVCERGCAFLSPFFEAGAVRVVADVGDHEVC